MTMRGIPLVWVLALAIAITCWSKPAGAQPTDSHSFRELGFGDQTARSMFGSVNYFFPVPSGQAPRAGAAIDLVVSHSAALTPDRSTITVAINGQSLTSALLTTENRDRTRLSVPLPTDGFTGAGFFVEVLFYLRLTRDACEATSNPALWATVHGESRLTLPLGPTAAGPQLSGLAGLLVPAGSGPERTSPLVIALPAAASADERRAAGLAAFQYGRWAGRAGVDPEIRAADSVPTDARAGILVATGGALAASQPLGRLRWDGRAFAGPDGAIAADAGVLALATQRPPTLVVSGATPAAVLTAAEALVQPERRDLLAGEVAVVTGTPIAWNSTSRPWQNGAASFAQLGVERREFRGPGAHTLQLTLERPPGWRLEDGGTLEMVIASTPALRRETSWVAARVNGIDLGAHQLAPPGGEAGTYRFALPAEQLNATLEGQPMRRLALEVELYLDIPDAGCTSSAPESAQASLLPTSAWRLPHDVYRGLDLGRFPAMFIDADRAPIDVVIPDGADAGEIGAGLEMSAALGRWSGSDEGTWPRLVTASAITEADRREHHLILVGGPERNSVSSAARAANRDLFAVAPPPLLAPASGRDSAWAILQLERSPWGRGRLLLALSGSDAGAVGLATDALVRRETAARLQGRTVTIVEGLPPQTVSGAAPAERPPEALAPRVESSFRDRLQPWQIVGAVLLGAFVATVGLLLAARLRRT